MRKRKQRRRCSKPSPSSRPPLEALLKLKKEDIAEVKVLPNPPPRFNLCVNACLELRPNGNEDPSQGWNAAKVMMNDANFLLKLKTYPKDADHR